MKNSNVLVADEKEIRNNSTILDYYRRKDRQDIKNPALRNNINSNSSNSLKVPKQGFEKHCTFMDILA